MKYVMRFVKWSHVAALLSEVYYLRFFFFYSQLRMKWLIVCDTINKVGG